MLPVAILAGGLATRLRPLTEKVPKALLEVAGAPFIHHQLALLSKHGVRRVVVCAGYLSEQIRQAVGNGEAWGLEVAYSIDWPDLLGTGGALKKALPLLGRKFMVLYGDSYLDVDYAQVERDYLQSGQPAMMTVYRNRGLYDTSNVVFDSGRVLFYSKTETHPDMCYIDYGLGLLSAALFSDYPGETAFDLAQVYTDLARKGKLAGCEMFQRFYEIGSLEGLRQTEEYIGA